MIAPRGFTSLQTKEAEYSFSGFIPTNKQTNKPKSHTRGLCLCPCVITPRGFTSLPTQEEEYSFSGFIPTNKQTNKRVFKRRQVVTVKQQTKAKRATLDPHTGTLLVFLHEALPVVREMNARDLITEMIVV